jgi:hypothetical protein
MSSTKPAAPKDQLAEFDRQLEAAVDAENRPAIERLIGAKKSLSDQITIDDAIAESRDRKAKEQRARDARKREEEEIDAVKTAAAQEHATLTGIDADIDIFVDKVAALKESTRALFRRAHPISGWDGHGDFWNQVEVAIADRLVSKGFPVRHGTPYRADEMPSVAQRAGYLLTGLPKALRNALAQRQAPAEDAEE